MGCISSKKEIEDIYPNIFQVMNVDEQGNRVNPGQLEITECDLVLYQRGKPPIKWPLRTLRRYGFDAEHFSFESGRRCQTGPGIYAFQCRRAEQLFNLLQSRIQIRTNGETDGTESLPNFPIVGNRESNYLEPAPLRRSNPGSRFSSQNGMTRLSSIGSASGSAGPLSPQSTTSPPLPLDTVPSIPPLPINRPLSQNLYANEEIIAAVTQDLEETNNNKTADEPMSPPPFEHSYSNSAVLESLPIMNPNNQTSDNEYTLLEEVSSPGHDNGHLYENIVPGTDNVISKFSVKPSQSGTNFVPLPLPLPIDPRDMDEPFHNYANCDANGSLPRKTPAGMVLPTTPPGEKRLNYIILDLEPSSDPPKSPTNSLPPDSPRKPTSGYAAIDFKKTEALSHSVNPTFDNEGSRKTRHNSNINELISQRQSSSVSD